MTSSAAMTRTRSQRPARIQSSAMATAWVVLAHAALICVFGPRAPMSSANWECPIDRTAEQEAAVERVAVLLQGLLQLADAQIDLGQRGALPVAVDELGAHRLHRRELLAAGAVDPVAGQLVGEVVVAGEGRGEDRRRCRRARHRGASSGRVAGCRRWWSGSADERDAGVAEGVDAGGDGQLRLAPERRDPLVVDAELGAEIELAGTAGQLDHVGRAVDGLEAGARLAFHEPGDVLAEDLLAQLRRDDVDALLAVQDAGDVGVVEDASARRATRAQRR